jgi:glycosyltransferase involved in cell wall biosynthesis
MAEREWPMVSIVVPCRNERDYIAPCLASILDSDYAGPREIVVVDGMSNDGTRDRVRELAAIHPELRLVDNPARVTPAALNIGIAETRGEVLMRMDAHVRYPRNYVRRLVDALETSGADNVGCVLRTRPGRSGPVAEAIALAMSHPFGVGNARFRTGASKPVWVDTVPFGCFRRDIFDRIGQFDPELVRNQDCELNGRIIRAGGRILLLPDLAVDYYARSSLSKLGRMYFQYGYFKPRVVRKLGAVPTVRQLVPAAFLLTLAAAVLATWLQPVTGRPFLTTVLGAYLSGLVLATALAWRRSRRASALLLPIVFPILHVAYGWGYLRGLFPALRTRAPDAPVVDMALTR